MDTRWTRRLTVLGLVVAGCASGPEPPPPIFPPPTDEEKALDRAEARKPHPVDARGQDVVTATVGTLGGVLHLSSGAELAIPQNALGQDRELTFSVGATSSAFQNNEDQRPIGPALQVAPGLIASPGTAFRLSVPFSHMPSGFDDHDLALATEKVDEQQRALEMGGVRTRWEYSPAHVEGNRLSAELSQLPGMRMQFLVSR